MQHMQLLIVTMIFSDLPNQFLPHLTFRPYEIGSVCPSVFPSVLLSRYFLGIVSLVFSKFWYVPGNPYEDLRDRAGFSRKNVLPPKLGK